MSKGGCRFFEVGGVLIENADTIVAAKLVTRRISMPRRNDTMTDNKECTRFIV